MGPWQYRISPQTRGGIAEHGRRDLVVRHREEADIDLPLLAATDDPLPPSLIVLGGASHGSVLNGDYPPNRPSAAWKPTASIGPSPGMADRFCAELAHRACVARQILRNVAKGRYKIKTRY